MNECKRYKDIFSEALYGELSEQENRTFQSHLSECPTCNAEFAELQKTLNIMDKREQPGLTSDYWERYWDKLETEVMKSKSSTPGLTKWWKNKVGSFRFEVKWTYQLVGALAMILIGIFIGSYFANNGKNKTGEKIEPNLSANIELANCASDYLLKSKILLLGLVNFDPEQDDPYAIDLPQKKQISRELVIETNYLKNKLETSQQTQLYELISDLEVILLQIANLESEYNVPEIEMVKSGVDRKGIFLKINIEEMRNYQSEKSADSKSKKKDTTI